MIIGKRIQLRAIEYDDLPVLVAWRNNPQIYIYFYEHEPLSLMMQKVWFDKLIQRPDEKLWIIEKIKGKQAIGMLGLRHIDWRNRNAELARVLILDSDRRSNLGSESVCLVMRYFFDHMNMNRLYCDTFAENKNAVLLYQKLGFKKEGVLRQHVFKEGGYSDVICLSILREEYLLTETKAIISKYID